jgi:hypothetical protein
VPHRGHTRASRNHHNALRWSSRRALAFSSHRRYVAPTFRSEEQNPHGSAVTTRVRPILLVCLALACSGSTDQVPTVAPRQSAPTLRSITLSPKAIRIPPGGEAQFTVQETWSDQTTRESEVDFTTTGGGITASGHYVAPLQPAQYLVVGTAKGRGWSDTAVVDVFEEIAVDTTVAPDTTVVLDTGVVAFHEPAGYVPIIERAVNSKPASGFEGFGSSGRYPRKTGGAEGWDEVDWANTRFVVVTDQTDAPTSPPNAYRAAYPAQVVPARKTYSPGTIQTFGFTTPRHGSKHYTQLYVRATFKLSNPFTYNPAGNKFWFVRSNEWKGAPRVEPIVGVNASGRLQFRAQGGQDGSLRSTAPNTGASGFVSLGRYHVVEALYILNSAHGVADGVFRMWLDGVKTHELTTVRYRANSLENAGFFWNQIHANSTWGGQGGTIPQNQYIWWDHFYVSGAP